MCKDRIGLESLHCFVEVQPPKIALHVESTRSGQVQDRGVLPWVDLSFVLSVGSWLGLSEDFFELRKRNQ